MRACKGGDYRELCESNIIIVVSPFGLSTAAEIGCVIKQKMDGEQKLIIWFQSEYGITKDEAAINPYVDHYVDSLSDLVGIIKSFLD